MVRNDASRVVRQGMHVSDMNQEVHGYSCVSIPVESRPNLCGSVGSNTVTVIEVNIISRKDISLWEAVELRV
jgi:hypothetical protein